MHLAGDTVCAGRAHDIYGVCMAADFGIEAGIHEGFFEHLWRLGAGAGGREDDPGEDQQYGNDGNTCRTAQHSSPPRSDIVRCVDEV